MRASAAAAGPNPALGEELPPKAALDGMIVGTAMPRVIAELQGFQHHAAVTTIYRLASTSSSSAPCLLRPASPSPC